MSEMVERVAKAIYDDIWEENVDIDHMKQKMLHSARAAIEATREPTDEIVRSVAKAIFETTSGHCRRETFEQAGGDLPSSGVQKVYSREARAAITAFLDAMNGSKTPSE